MNALELGDNPFLAGNYAPVSDESDFDLNVTGELPKDLVGTFYRNGPNPQFAPADDYHWFAGDGMIHAFFVGDGKVRYRNRYIRTPKWLAENAAGRSLFGSFGNPRTTDPSMHGLDRGVANTSLVWHSGKLLTLEEAHRPFQIDPLTLESYGYASQYPDRVTAHPKIDPETGEMLWFAYAVGGSPSSKVCTFGVTDSNGKIERCDRFEAPYSSFVHDFLVTRRHVLFPILPLAGDLQRVMKGGSPYDWDPDKGSFVGVLARNAPIETMRWFEVDTCFVYHAMNAWEEGSKIFADVMEHPDAELIPKDSNTVGKPVGAQLVRWTLDLAVNSNRVKREQLDDLPGEFPRFDERSTGLNYSHGWFAGNSRKPRPGSRTTGLFDCIAHVDLHSGKRNVFNFDLGDGPGEPIFVPRSAQAEEGDGWVVTTVYRGEIGTSDFLVFDAQNISAGPIASARLPRRVPFGFHGSWRPG